MEPTQSKKEEIFNAITHGVGFLLAIAMLVLVIVFAESTREIIAVSVYGATLVLLYLTSTLYHAIPVQKNVFKRLDHCAIYLLIAGTYTPLLLVTIRGALGWTFFGVIWGLAILGVIYKSIWGDKHIFVSTMLYLIMGWIVLAFIVPLFKSVSSTVFLFLVLGGLSYSIGVIFFLRKEKYMHVIWHLFVLCGSVFHFFAILLL